MVELIILSIFSSNIMIYQFLGLNLLYEKKKYALLLIIFGILCILNICAIPLINLINIPYLSPLILVLFIILLVNLAKKVQFIREYELLILTNSILYCILINNYSYIQSFYFLIGSMFGVLLVLILFDINKIKSINCFRNIPITLITIFILGLLFNRYL